MQPLSSLAPVFLMAAAGMLAVPVHGQRTGGSSPNDTLGLAHGYLPLTTRHFAAELVRDAQVLVSLRAAGSSSSSSFDYLPRDRLTSRARNGQHHWGDVNVRYRVVAAAAADKNASTQPWIDVSSSAARKPVMPLPQGKQTTNVNGSSSTMTVLASTDLGPTLSPGGTGLPFAIVREWLDVDGDLGLRFRITYARPPSSLGDLPILQIGGLGFPATANSIFTGRSPEEVQAMCSLADPYVGMDAGYLRIAPVSGKDDASVLLVTPLRGTRTPFEAYRNLDEPADDAADAYGTQSFEGFYEWQAVTAAWADGEWQAGRAVPGVVGSTGGAPWNGGGRGVVTLRRPGDFVEFGLRFSLTGATNGGGGSTAVKANGPQAVDATLRRPDLDMPVVRGVPGYVLARDLPGQLFVWPPNDTRHVTVEVHPAGTLSLMPAANTTNATSLPLEYVVTPSASAWGRVRVDLTYHLRDDANSTILQTVHYYVTKPAADAVADLGRFLTTSQLFADARDPFGRGSAAAPSILTYDAERGAVVQQDPRVWIAGLSDEAGAGSYLAAAAKQAARPDAAELAVLVPFVDRVLWGVVQDNGSVSGSGAAAAAGSAGTSTGDPYGVRKSVFFHDPAALPRYAYDRAVDWSSWTSWTRAQAYKTDRAYDYVHAAAAYWALYRAARAHPEVFAGLNYTYTAFSASTTPPWQWYLRQAAETVRRAMATSSAGIPKAEHANDGLMGETVWGALLTDLQREGADDKSSPWMASAATIEGLMRARARRWAAAAVPFGSEMAWDSTAQEGVHLWAARFGDAATARKAVEAVVGYAPAVPHWGWNGNARRYWDNVYGGKLRRIERQVHHYGSALNGLVLLGEAATTRREQGDPSSSYLVRLGFAGVTAPLTNIAPSGFAAASFHSWPDTLAWDAYSGDYGPGFLGMVLGGGTYVVKDTEALSTGRLLCYGGVMEASGINITVRPRDAWRRRIFVGPLGLLVTIDAGVIESFAWSTMTAKSSPLSLTIRQLEGGPRAAAAVLWIEASAATASSNYSVVSAQTSTSLARSRGGWRVPLPDTTPVAITIKLS